MLLKLIPDNTKIPFTRARFAAVAISAALVVGSIAALATLGLNFGVDFRGGIAIEVSDSEPISLSDVRSATGALGLGEVTVTEIQDFAGADKAVLVAVEQQQAAPGESDVAQQRAGDKVREALRTLLGDDIVFLKTEIVSPTVSGELVNKGILAVALAIGGMLLYIWLRFEWQFAIGSIVALVHDVAITLGFFAVTRLDFNLSIIAAILTIIGYSMNDTVVVYDRVRENLRKFKKMPLTELINLSINDTLTRTVMTSGTTLIALLSLFIFGGEVLRGFTSAIIFGIVIGTYSSIFVASPFLLATGVKRDWSKIKTAEA